MNSSNNGKNNQEYLLRKEQQEKAIRRLEKQVYEDFQLKEFGVITRKKRSRSDNNNTVVVIPVEIEVSYELDSFVKHEILDKYGGRSYTDWIQECYIHRMRQILEDPAEFGKVVLERKKSDHCINNADDI